MTVDAQLAALARHAAKRRRSQLEAWVKQQGDHVRRSSVPALWYNEAKWYARARDAREQSGAVPAQGPRTSWRSWGWWRARPARTLPARVVADPVPSIVAPGCPEWALAAFATGTDFHPYVRMLAVAHTRDPELLDVVLASAVASEETETLRVMAMRVVAVALENPACPGGAAQHAVASYADFPEVLAAAAGSIHLPDDVRVMVALLRAEVR